MVDENGHENGRRDENGGRKHRSRSPRERRDRRNESVDVDRKPRDRERDTERGRGRDREREREKERSLEADRKPRDKDTERSRDRDRERRRERSLEADRKPRDREREREKERSLEAERKPRDRGRERSLEADRKPRDRERERDKERSLEAERKPRDRDRGRESERPSEDRKPRDRDRGRENEKLSEEDRNPRDRERDRIRERDRDKEGDRDKDRGRRDASEKPRDKRREEVARRDRRSPSTDRREKRERSVDADRNERKKVKVEGDQADNKLEAEDKKEVKKVEPLSLEDLLKKRQEEAAELAKPKFLTKKQREELAMKRREEEAGLQRQKVEEQRKALFGPSAASVDKDGPSDRNRDRDRESERDREREKERERARDRDRERERERRDRDRGRDDKTTDDRDKERKERVAQKEQEKELQAIKEQYLGLAKKKKRVIRPSDKFKFAFDWEATEDTSRDLNPIYNNPHEAQLLFGRGLKAGIDVRTQKKAAALHEKDLLAQRRRETGEEQTEEERASDIRKAKAADEYNSSFDMRVDAHWKQKKREHMTERDWRIFREDYNISFKGSNVPKPMRNWDESGLSKEVLQAVEKAGYKEPSPIQMAAIPLGLQQRDVIGIAETGSGKTAAFVLPMLMYISQLPPLTEENEALGPYALIMAPTRELAQQIEEETVKFASYMDFRVTSIVGGQSIEEQGFKLRQGCEIVIATPGRMLDCLERRYAVLQQCHYVVLDEADRMIDMGFEPQVAAVLDLMPSSNLKPEGEDEELEENKIYRTTYMFSATMPPAVERLARKYLRQPVVVTIGHAGKTTELITQHIIMVKSESEKKDKLNRILADLGERQSIIFVNQKKTADGLARQLERDGYKVTSLHGGKIQETREVSLEGFRQKKFTILVATDVAGRGIDIPDVAQVVNYDMPTNIEQYTHRIGRTGRAGKTGIATTFLTGHDTDVYYDLKQMLINSNSPVPPELSRHEAAKFKPGTIRDRPA